MNALKNWLAFNDRSQQWLANQLGIKQSSVNSWLKEGIPVERVPEISEVTGLTRGELRPDFWDPACRCHENATESAA